SVAPRTGAWIETASIQAKRLFALTSPLVQGRGLKHRTTHAHFAKYTSPLVQGRGLKLDKKRQVDCRRRSPLVQGRGLKLVEPGRRGDGLASPLVQGRGLKRQVFRADHLSGFVAPRTGAWIETALTDHN